MRVRYDKDQSTVREISRHLVSCDPLFLKPLSERLDIGDYASKLERAATRFEAWDGPRLVGLVAAYFNSVDGETVFVTNVSVETAYARQGIARNLVRRCLDLAGTDGFKAAILNVDAAAENAIALYKGLGFAVTGVEKSGELKMACDTQS